MGKSYMYVCMYVCTLDMIRYDSIQFHHHFSAQDLSVYPCCVIRQNGQDIVPHGHFSRTFPGILYTCAKCSYCWFFLSMPLKGR